MSCKKQEFPAIRVHLGSFPVFGSVCVTHLFSIMCCVFFVFCLSSSCVWGAECFLFIWIVYS